MVLVFHQHEGLEVLVANQAAGGGGGLGGVVPVCVCALFMGHIGYISLKTKNIIFFFIIKVFAKTRNYKKRSVSAVHFEAEMSVFCVSASCHLLTPDKGLFSGPLAGKLYPGRFTLDLLLEGCTSQYIYI